MARLVDRLGEAVAAWNRGDLDGYLTLYDPAMRLHGYSPEPMDKAAATTFYRALCAALTAEARPAPALEIFDPMADGRWVAVHFRLQGRTGARSWARPLRAGRSRSPA